MTRYFLLLISVFLLLASNARAADVKKQLQGISKEIKEKKRLISKKTREESVVSSELSTIDKKLKEKQANLNSLNLDLREVEKNISHTGSEMTLAQEDVAKKKLEIQKRLVAVYKSGDVGNIRIFFSSETFPQMIEDRRYMKALLENDRKMISEYNAKLERLKGLKGTLERDAERKERIKTHIEANKKEIEAEKRKKADYLVKVKEDKKKYQTSLLELQANSRRLQAIVARLEAISRREAARQAALRQAALRQQAALRRANNRKVENNRAEDKASKTPAPLPYSGPVAGSGFSAQRGRLAMPVRGRILSGFGRHKHPQFNSYTVSNGISIAAPTGTDVHAIYDGKVIFADYFKGYGNMVIVDHGGGYFSLYAHNSRILKKVGTNVAKNDTLASVGDADSTNGSMLYFEIRFQGKPVDPSSWVR